MSFLLLLLVSFSALLQVEIQSATVLRSDEDARLNALLGLHSALGALQQHLGPDQRVSARAELFDDTPAYDESLPEHGQSEGVNEPFWSGVWTVDPADFDDANSRTPFENPSVIKAGPDDAVDNRSGAIAWLVSPDGANPFDHERSEADVPLFLVDNSWPGDPRNIFLPPTEIERSSGEKSGHFAWWVSDEGIKASISLEDEHANVTSADELNRRLVTAPRMAPEMISGNGVDAAEYDLSILTSLNNLDKALSRVDSNRSFSVLLDKAGANNPLRLSRNRFHDVTPMAMGVLADARSGGLKRNLTVALGSDAGFQELLADHGGELIFGRAQVNGNDNKFNPANSTTVWTNNPAAESAEHRYDPGGPPWAQLRSFFELRADKTFQGEPAAQVRKQLNDQAGVYPVLSHFQMHFHWVLLDERPMGTDEPPYKFRIRQMVFPAVILWNPYNVALEETDYSVYLGLEHETVFENQYLSVDYKLNYGARQIWPDDTQALTASFVSQDKEPWRFDFSAGFAPGEAKLFLPAEPLPLKVENGDLNGGLELVDASDDNFDQGGYFFNDMRQSEGGPTLFFEPGGPANTTERLTEIRIVPRARGEKWENGQFVEITVNGVPNEHRGTIGLFLRNEQEVAQRASQPEPGQFRTRPLQVIRSFTYRPGWQPFRYENSVVTGDGFARTSKWDGHPVTSFKPIPGTPGFPMVGFSMHRRWIENAYQPLYSSPQSDDAGDDPFDPQFATLSYFNARAPMNVSASLDLYHQRAHDAWFNPQYYVDAERMEDIIGGDSSWGFLESLIGNKIRVGFSDDSTDPIKKNTLFDIPEGPESFQNISELQHAPLAMTTPGNPSNDYTSNYSFWFQDRHHSDGVHPAYAIGNSIMSPYVPTNSLGRGTWPWTNASQQDGLPRGGDRGWVYDWSYLINDQLFDRYFFSSYDSDADELLNPRFTRTPGSTSQNLDSYENAASDLMTRGSFNVNSTSVAAWRAFLSGLAGAGVPLRNGDIASMQEGDSALTPFVRNQEPIAGDARNQGIESTNVYSGFVSLSEDEIEDLAKKIVEQVKKRGPFVSMAHFVNRVVDDPAFMSAREASNLEGRERAIGALQAALEHSIVNEHLREPEYVLTMEEVEDRVEEFDAAAAAGDLAYGQPGYVTQADLLSTMDSVLAVRSDTFLIRAYGDSVDPLTDEIKGKAWCEAVVQRVPDEVSPGSNTRRFVIVRFRWLNENDI